MREILVSLHKQSTVFGYQYDDDGGEGTMSASDGLNVKQTLLVCKTE